MKSQYEIILPSNTKVQVLDGDVYYDAWYTLDYEDLFNPQVYLNWENGYDKVMGVIEMLSNHKCHIKWNDRFIVLENTMPVARLIVPAINGTTYGINVCEQSDIEVVNLPDPLPFTFYMVSNIMRLALFYERDDLVSPLSVHKIEGLGDLVTALQMHPSYLDL